LKLHPKAVNELEEAYRWYEKRLEGLGRRFFAAINKRILEIQDYPDRYPIKHKNYREVGIEVFPFIIVNEIFDSEKVVFASYIFHNKKSPKRKYLR
jgi:hypothetical protein